MKSIAIKLPICLLVCMSVSACFTDQRKIDYKNTRQLPPLEVPPDLATMPESVSPTAGPSRTAYSEVVGDKPGSGTVAANVVLPQVAGVSMERDGQTRWLLVQASPENLYPYIRQFVTSVGLAIARENPVTGVIETDWLETPAKSASSDATLPVKWLTRFPAATTRDKFRLRLERGVKPGTTEIYFAHYGIEEEAGRNSSASGWQPRAPEPDVEAEMLRLLIAYLGKTDAQAKSVVAQAAAPTAERAELRRRGDSFLLSLNDSLDRAWRRVGLSLDRIGFTVEDRDRSKGIYYVRYLDPEKTTAEPGWFSKLFGADAKKSEERYQIMLQGAADGTQVVVRTSDGDPEFGTTSERILSLLYEQLK